MKRHVIWIPRTKYKQFEEGPDFDRKGIHIPFRGVIEVEEEDWMWLRDQEGIELVSELPKQNEPRSRLFEKRTESSGKKSKEINSGN